MEDILWGLVIGFPTGLIVGVVLAISIKCCLMYQKICNVQVNGANLGAAMLDSTTEAGRAQEEECHLSLGSTLVCFQRFTNSNS
ncbi:hypothetical protein ACOSQ4_012342 [Xanthoceras sorbifolium]